MWKIRLIESMNPEWADLFEEFWGEIAEGPADRGAPPHRAWPGGYGTWVPAWSRSRGARPKILRGSGGSRFS